MFVQVIEGRAGDVGGLRQHIERWMRDLAPGAEGFLGTTGGVTADGTFVGVVRFESEAAARANSDRPEQGAWWDQTKGTFEGEVTFTDCPEVDTFGEGGSDDAGFVQIIEGRADRSAVAPLADEFEAALGRMRPDVIGGIVGWPGDGRFVQVVYFTSESEARTAESTPPSPEDQAQREQMAQLMEFDRYLDLPDPWLYSR